MTRPLCTELASDDCGFEPHDAEPFDDMTGPMMPEDMALIERAILLDIQQWESCPFIAGRIRRKEANQ